MTATITDQRVLLAYLVLRPGAPEATCGLLRDYIETFAPRAGYILKDIFVAAEGHGEPLTVRTLIERLRGSEVNAVLVSGPARPALIALQQFAGVKVLTLADLNPHRWWPPDEPEPHHHEQSLNSLWSRPATESVVQTETTQNHCCENPGRNDLRPPETVIWDIRASRDVPLISPRVVSISAMPMVEYLRWDQPALI